jgi:hypothetical protein
MCCISSVLWVIDDDILSAFAFMKGYAYCKIWEHTANVYHGSLLSFQFQSSFLSMPIIQRNLKLAPAVDELGASRTRLESEFKLFLSI